MDSDSVTGLFILMGSCGIPLALPLIFGTIILRNFWEDNVGRLLGFLTLKILVAFPIVLYFYGISLNKWGIAIPFTLYVFVTLCILYLFRDSFKLYRIVRFLLLGDFIGWLVVFVLLMFWNSLGITIFLAFLPTIYATISLLYAYKRSDSLKILQ